MQTRTHKHTADERINNWHITAPQYVNKNIDPMVGRRCRHIGMPIWIGIQECTTIHTMAVLHLTGWRTVYTQMKASTIPFNQHFWRVCCVYNNGTVYIDIVCGPIYMDYRLQHNIYTRAFLIIRWLNNAINQDPGPYYRTVYNWMRRGIAWGSLAVDHRVELIYVFWVGI